MLETPSRADLVARGYDVGPEHSEKFLHDLKDGHAKHFGMCEQNPDLHEASKNGQKPKIAAVSGTDTSVATIMRRNPSTIFAITCPGGIVSKSTLAAVYYAGQHLEIEELQPFFSNSAPLLPYMLGQKTEMTGPHMQMWKDKVWNKLLAPFEANKEYQAMTRVEKFKLASIQICQKNGDILRDFIKELGLSSKIIVVPASLDSQAGIVTYYDRPVSDEPYFIDSYQTVSPISGNVFDPPKRFGCSCCDSRALHSHIYCTTAGEYAELDVIAGFVPDYDETLLSGEPNSAWLQLEMSKAEGCKEYVLTAHTKCGGIEALMKWCRTGHKPHNPILKTYLAGAKPIADEILKFAVANGFGDESEESRAKLCRLAEMHIARVSATRIKKYVGDDSQVLINYLNIESQQAYALPLLKNGMTDLQKIRDTYWLAEDYRTERLITLFGLYNVLSEPKRDAAHEGQDGAFRRARERRARLSTE